MNADAKGSGCLEPDPRSPASIGGSFLGFVALLMTGVSAAPANEKAFQDLWDRHLAAGGDHALAIQACDAFAAQNPADALLPAAAGIKAWHWLQAGKTEAAAGIFQSTLAGGTDPVAAGAALVAKGWLTRLDREKLLPALRAYYRHEVAYPAKLDDLFKHPKTAEPSKLPASDRFGEAWDYRLAGFAKVAGFQNQRFELQSRRLGALSDLATALKAPYGLATPVKPVKLLPGSPPMVAFKQGAAAGAIAAGQEFGGVHLAYLGERFLVVCDPSGWMLFPAKF